MKFRRASPADWDEVLKIQEANLRDKLTEAQRAQGFLTVRFERAQFEQMDTGAAVAIAHDHSRIAGYICASTQAFNAGVPVIGAMMTVFPKLSLSGKPLASTATAIYGPVCVDHRDRGQGVLGGLIQQLKNDLTGRFELAAGFIAKDNARSLAAHVDGAGMDLLGDFEFAGRGFWIVAFPIPREAVSCVL